MRALLAVAAMAALAMPAYADGPKVEAYAGATAGYSGVEVGGDEGVFDKGVAGGAFVGLTTRLDGLVLGIEGDGMVKDIEVRETDSGFAATASSDYLLSVRGRAGVEFGPVLIYGTAGLAFTDLDIDIQGVGSDQQWLMGFAYGAGMEAHLTKTVFIRLEALEYKFEDEKFDIGGASDTIDQDESIVRVGFGFRLN